MTQNDSPIPINPASTFMNILYRNEAVVDDGGFTQNTYRCFKFRKCRLVNTELQINEYDDENESVYPILRHAGTSMQFYVC